jgi:hypothetical protein
MGADPTKVDARLINPVPERVERVQQRDLKAAFVRSRHPELSGPEVRARAWKLIGGDQP